MTAPRTICPSCVWTFKSLVRCNALISADREANSGTPPSLWFQRKCACELTHRLSVIPQVVKHGRGLPKQLGQPRIPGRRRQQAVQSGSLSRLETRFGIFNGEDAVNGETAASMGLFVPIRSRFSWLTSSAVTIPANILFRPC